jgi:hypothetical protein
MLLRARPQPVGVGSSLPLMAQANHAQEKMRKGLGGGGENFFIFVD